MCKREVTPQPAPSSVLLFFLFKRLWNGGMAAAVVFNTKSKSRQRESRKQCIQLRRMLCAKRCRRGLLRRAEYLQRAVDDPASVVCVFRRLREAAQFETFLAQSRQHCVSPLLIIYDRPRRASRSSAPAPSGAAGVCAAGAGSGSGRGCGRGGPVCHCGESAPASSASCGDGRCVSWTCGALLTSVGRKKGAGGGGEADKGSYAS